MSKVRIVAAVAAKAGVTLYYADGTSQNVKNSRYRTADLLERVLKPLARKEVVEVDLDDYTFTASAEVEKKSSGLIRFVRMSVAKVKEILKKPEKAEGTESIDPALLDKVLGVIPGQDVTPTSAVIEEPDHAKTELVAIVSTSAGDVEIPNVDGLERHMEDAVISERTEGFNRFMARLATVAKERKHTAQELINFMKRADLPIADDGSIIAYKVLKTNGNGERLFGTFYDCHSGNVPQKVGSFVHMPVDLVDENRRNECSTGFHIARRGYIKRFGGDVIVLVKIAPEDVVAVPYNEPDKMRVAGYHILFALPSSAIDLLRQNKAMTAGSEASMILGNAIAGRHIGVLEKVHVAGPHGTKITVTPANEPKPEKPIGHTVEVEVEARPARAIDEENLGVNLAPVLNKEMVAQKEATFVEKVTEKPAESVAKPEKAVSKPRKAKAKASKPETKAKKPKKSEKGAATATKPIEIGVELPDDPTALTIEEKDKLAWSLKREGQSIRAISKLLRMDRERLGVMFRGA